MNTYLLMNEDFGEKYITEADDAESAVDTMEHMYQASAIVVYQLTERKLFVKDWHEA